MRSLLYVVLLLLIRIAESEKKTNCVEIEKGFKEELNSHKQPVCICADVGIFTTVQGFSIECESASIASVSENLQSLNGTDLGRLTIRDSVVNVLPLDVFEHVNSKQVKLERCGLSALPPKSFYSLGESLEFLSLRENRIKILEKGAFEGLTKLTNLDLAMNKIQELEAGAFKELVNVEDILLNENEILELKSGTFEGLKKLRKLTIQSCGLETIEKGAFRGLENLEELILSHNRIQNVNWAAFASLKNLRVLDLGSNLISNIELKSFPKLEKLVLNNNTIDSMKSIKLKDLPSLIVVMFDRNKIRSINDMDMFGLTRSDRIETMSLAWNNLTQISSKAFQHTPNLITLLLQHNQIQELSSNSSTLIRTPFLAILKKLATLQLSANNLTIIRSDELPKSLINLALDHNVITKIEARALEEMAIRRLYLHNNKLSYLYRGTFDSFEPSSIEAIDVSSNSWQCICNDPREWLPRWLSEAEESDVAEGPVGCLAIPECGQDGEPNKIKNEKEEVVRSGWITVAATILTVITIIIMVIIAMLYFKDYRHQFPLRGHRSDSDLHKLIENDPLNIPSDSILVVPAMPKRNVGPKKTVRFQNF
uniref:LRRCT domain-containing protein n=1 Tax=Caenorhabditis tropicalis TaxID=1561998 RepID=A0A1I7T8H1_9PELO